MGQPDRHPQRHRLPPRLHRPRDAARIWSHQHERPPLRPADRPLPLHRQLRAGAVEQPELQPIQLLSEQPIEIHRFEW